jgi:serine/threonine protein kinase
MPPLRLDMSPEACNDRLALYVGVAKLSEGPHGCAFSVRHTRSKKLCTMHVVEWEDLNAGSKEANDALKRHVLAEAELLVTHKHKHMATMVECFAASDVANTLLATADDNKSATALCYCIVTAAEDSTLQNIIDANKDLGERVSKTRISKWVHQAVAALAHLHANGILHRQLRPENILIDHNDDLKLGHFGMTGMMTRELADAKYAQSVPYMSPETFPDGTVDPKSDLWALGCVLHALMTFEAYPFVHF